MTDISKWKHLYKINYEDGTKNATNMLYTPYISDDGKTLCMWYDEKNPYQVDNPEISKELVDFFYQRELSYLQKFQGYSWTPKLLDVEQHNNRIFIEFNKETLNNIVMNPDRDIIKELPNWKAQVFSILSEIDRAGYYKLALYPHCFYIGEHDELKTIDYYSFIEKDDCCIERSKIEGMIGSESTGRFDKSTVGDMINFEIFFKTTMLEHLGQRWSDNPFPEFYERLNGK
jgi:hypothetical protein